jgi:hypothetical protein
MAAMCHLFKFEHMRNESSKGLKALVYLIRLKPPETIAEQVFSEPMSENALARSA